MSRKQWLGVLRHVLTGFGGYFVAKGWVDESIIQEFIGAFITVIGTVWSIREKNTDPKIDTKKN